MCTSPSSLWPMVLLLAVAVAMPLRADYLKNSDFKSGSSYWRGDGSAAFLNPDGTEGTETDKGAIPVLKIGLSHGHSLAVYQEYQTKDNPKSLHIRVEVYASSDFKRSKFANDYSSEINWKAGSTWYWGDTVVPNVDFWIRADPGFAYKLSNLKPGQWTTVDAVLDNGLVTEDRAVWFIVPPGDGTIYIRKPSVTP